MLAKLFAEAVESIDPQPVEGIRSTGASALHEIVYGVIPQVMPLWISYALYRFESNVRSASVVGMVGAGGIGVVLWEIIRGFQYAQTCAVMIIIVVTVGLIDVTSARILTSKPASEYPNASPEVPAFGTSSTSRAPHLGQL